MKKIAAFLGLAGLAAVLGAAEPAAIFSDGMILQRGREVPVWGTGLAGENVAVEFQGQRRSAVTDDAGKWRVTLAPLAASSEGANFTVTGDNTVTRRNVLVGDVWLCAGQSNMQWPLKKATGGAELAKKAEHSAIRFLQVPRDWSRTPWAEIKLKWTVCTPATAAEFSAVGYLTGREIQEKTGVPVGLIHISWGGCRIESLSAPESFREAGVKKEVADAFEKELRAELLDKPDGELRKDTQRLPTGLFNAMVYPLTPFAVRGMLWYQGEDNHWQGMRYAEKLRALAHSWRKYFEYAKMPVFIVQLPPWKYKAENIPDFWTAQQYFAEHDVNAGFIVATDCGDPEDIHPPDKAPLAGRLAGLVLYKEYGIGDSSALSPVFKNAVRKGNTATVEFSNPNGLATRDGQGVAFLMLAGADRKFHPAQGRIQDDRLIVSAPEVASPVWIRFGWDKLADPNLVNRAGVPVAPFERRIR